MDWIREPAGRCPISPHRIDTCGFRAWRPCGDATLAVTCHATFHPAHQPRRTYTPTYLQARYGAQAATWPVRRHPVVEHILSHRSVRNFLPDALPPDTVQTRVH